MLIIFRMWYFVGLAGLVLAGFGIAEARLAMNAATEPEVISVADLEDGKRPSQPYVKIDNFYAVYGVSSYETKGDRVTSTIYPILSSKHPWMVGRAALNEKYSNAGEVPEDEMPDLEPLRVLVKTDRFERVEEIPDDGEDVDSAIGILYGYDELNSDEQELVRMVSNVSASSVMLEIGRKPKSLATSIGMAVIGVLLIAVAVMLFFRGRSRGEQRDAE